MRASERRFLLKSSNKPVNIKYHNQKLILSLFRQADTLSIAEISEKLKLSKTTIAKVVGEFEGKGLILGAGKGESTEVGGKKPERFAFNPVFSRVAAIVIRRDRIFGAITDLRGKPLHLREADCGIGAGYEPALDQMAEMIQGLLGDAKLEPARLCGLTLGCEGVVDVESNRVRYTLHHHTWGRNLDIGGDLAKRLPFPIRIRIDNGTRLAGYNHRDVERFGTVAVINCGRTTGGSIMDGRELIHGDNGFVGEFGHLIIDPSSSVRCKCGGRGCFEALASPDRILEAAGPNRASFPESPLQASLPDRLAIGDVFAAAAAGDPFARFLLDPIIGCFSILVHHLVLLRDPARIVILGLYAGAGDYFLSEIRRRVREIPFYRAEYEPQISYADSGAVDPALLGAARFGADEFLRNNRLYD